MIAGVVGERHARLVSQPIGLRDREAGTRDDTTSRLRLRKLDRLRREPRMALAYHARNMGSPSAPSTCSSRAARRSSRPDRDYLEDVVGRPPSGSWARPSAAVLGPLAGGLLRRTAFPSTWKSNG